MSNGNVLTPDSWVTPETFHVFAAQITGNDPSAAPIATNALLGKVLSRFAVPTHEVDHQARKSGVGYKRVLVQDRPSRRQPTESRPQTADEINAQYGSHSLIRLFDPEAGAQAELEPRYYDRLTRLANTNTLAAGVRLPEDEYTSGGVEVPFVAQVAGYDFSVTQVFATEGFIDALRHTRPSRGIGTHRDRNYQVLVEMFDLRPRGPIEPVDMLRGMAIPTSELTLLTSRGLASAVTA